MKKIKLFIIIIVVVLFSNCGYQPIYSNKIQKNDEFLSIRVKNIKDRPGQILKNDLTDRLNPNNKKKIPKYYLEVKLNESKQEIGYKKDLSATRTNLIVNAKYILRNIKAGDIILKNDTKTISSYDVVESTYATIIAEKDAREKTMKIIADTIITDLAVFFNNK